MDTEAIRQGMDAETIPWAEGVQEALRRDPLLTKAEIARALGISEPVCAYRLDQSSIEIKRRWRKQTGEKSPGARFLAENAKKFVWTRRNGRLDNLDPERYASLKLRLGQEPDMRLAEEFGLYPALVAAIRKEEGIEAYSERKKPLPEGLEARLGKEPDAALAEEFGLSRQRIAQIRVEFKIPPVSQYVAPK